MFKILITASYELLRRQASPLPLLQSWSLYLPKFIAIEEHTEINSRNVHISCMQSLCMHALNTSIRRGCLRRWPWPVVIPVMSLMSSLLGLRSFLKTCWNVDWTCLPGGEGNLPIYYYGSLEPKRQWPIKHKNQRSWKRGEGYESWGGAVLANLSTTSLPTIPESPCIQQRVAMLFIVAQDIVY